MGFTILKKMNCLTVNNCCCGCSLRKGSMVIGLAFGVLSLLTTVGLGSMADHFANEKGEVNGEVAMYIGATIVWACFTIADLLLIAGASQEIPCLLIFWMVATTVNLLVYIGLYAYVCYEISTYGSGGEMAIFMTIVTALLLVGLFGYCLLVVYSYYRRIVASRAIVEEPPSQPDPNARRWR